MRTVLRIVNLPVRLTSVPKPVALRYLDKDDMGNTRICVRTTQRKQLDETAPASLPRLSPAKTTG